ncbi:MAG: hypothetical protein KQH59_18570 [Desulfobulbaceae bacterium]|nr:hypothetical protein [Desulfobulbaceae bacterium]
METQQIIWRRVADGLPDSDELVLVYSGSLDDVVFGYLSINPVTGDEDSQVWINAQDGYPLPDPVCWAAVPFPETMRVAP